MLASKISKRFYGKVRDPTGDPSEASSPQRDFIRLAKDRNVSSWQVKHILRRGIIYSCTSQIARRLC
jgi:hypothetical protein